MKKRFKILSCLLSASILYTSLFAGAYIPANAAYSYKPEEIMYLSGIKKTAYKEGKSYTLYDINGDSVSELFVRKADGTTDLLKVFIYDKKTNKPKKSITIKNVKNVYSNALGKAITVETLNKKKRMFTDYKIAKKSLKKIKSSKLKKKSLADQKLVFIGDDQWVDSTVVGVGSSIKNPGYATDFHLASNYKYMSKEHIGDSMLSDGTLNHMKEAVDANKKQLLSDRTKYTSDNIRRVRDYYDVLTDWDKRDSDGITYAKNLIDEVYKTGSLDELSNVITDPAKDPFVHLIGFELQTNPLDNSKWTIDIVQEDFSVIPRVYNDENASKEDYDEVRGDFKNNATYVLGRCGYTKEQIKTILNECFETEDAFISYITYADDEDSIPYYTIDEICGGCKNFPLKKLLNNFGAKDGMVRNLRGNFLTKVDNYYTQSNLSKIKSYIIAHMANTAISYLDLESEAVSYGYFDNKTGKVSDYNKDEFKKSVDKNSEALVLDSGDIMGAAMESAYMEYFVDNKIREDLTKLVYEIRDSFREILENETWLSDESKNNAIEKLDNMTFSVMSTDDLVDTSYLDINKNESLFEIYAKLYTNTLRHKLSYAGKEVDRNAWQYDLMTGTMTSIDNCFNFQDFNRVFICAGFVTEDTYSLDMTKEEKLGRIGAIIGHEITHGFDPTGMKHDKYGN
ncbi:MAG: hypothetical protein K6F00_00005, partial [Lachnospiraceae bacterium]|nr:hypothetical protein [Lachnospiraceae bacterium]